MPIFLTIRLLSTSTSPNFQWTISFLVVTFSNVLLVLLGYPQPLSDIGIGNGLKNRLTEAIANEDNEKAQIFISTAYLGTTVIAGVFCVLLIYFWNLVSHRCFHISWKLISCQ